MSTFLLSSFLCLIFIAVGIFWFRLEKSTQRRLTRQLNDLGTRMKAVSRDLEEQKARLETTFSGMVEGVVLTDQRGDILHVNPAFREMFVLKRKIEGKSTLEILANVSCDDAIREVIEKLKPVEREIVFENPRRRVFQVYFSPMHREGKLFGVVLVFHDLTEFRRLEQVRRDFIANLSHEIKTPLTVIRGYGETLLEEAGSLPENTRRHLEIIFRHVTDLEHLMENLLNLSRIESGKDELVLEKIPLKNFTDCLLDRFAHQAKIKEIQLHNEVSNKAPSLKADSSKLNQILSNLVDNAIKYTPSGGNIWIRSSTKNGRCEIEVQDTGQGIPQEEQERIFERFYRIDKSRSRGSGGTGLGLSIVKHLMALHGGQIHVKSAEGNGTSFIVTFSQS